MKKNFTQLIPASTWPQPQLAVKATLLFLLMLVFNAASAQVPGINTSDGLNQTCATVSRGFELTINGTNFSADAAVRFRGASLQNEEIITPKSVTAGQLKVDIPGNSAVLANVGPITVDVRQDLNGTATFSNAVALEVYPATATITGPASVCASAAANYSVPALDGAAEYLWSVTSGNATITNGGTTPTAEISFSNTAGPVSIRVVINPECGGAANITANFNVTVNTVPNVSLAAFGNICTNAGVITLTGGSPAGGTYTVDGVVATRTDADGVTTSTFDPATATPGDHEIIYYFTQNGCTGSAKQTFTVLQAPSASLAPIANVCSNAPAFNLIGGSPGGGTYEVDGLPATSFNPATATLGTHTVTYTVSQGGCTSTATQTFLVSTPPSVSLAPFNDICSNATPFALSGGLPAGGTYTGPGVTNGQFNPATAGVGTHTITYTVAQNGCTISETQTITVLPSPTVSLEPLANVCADAGLITLNGALPAGGTFTGSGVTNGQFNPAAAGVGTHIITYTVEQNGCRSTATRSITVVQPPSVTIDTRLGTQSCQGGTIPLSVTNTFGAAYQWFRDGVALANANTHNLNADRTGSYNVRVTNNGCSVTSTTVEVTILNPATIIAEGPNVQLCTPETTVLHAVTGYTGYQWYKDNVLLTGQTSPTLTVTQTGDYYVVVNTTIGPCLTVTSTVTRVNIGSAIANNTINAISPVCAGSPVTVTGQAATGGSGTPSYQWQISINGSTYTDVATDGNNQDYTYTATNVTQTTTVSFRRVVTAGACTSTSTPVSVTINPEIVASALSTNNRTVCEGNNSLSFGTPTISGGAGPNTYTYQWQISSTGDPNSFTNIPNANTRSFTYAATSAGTFYIRRVITSGGCSNISGIVPITVTPPITNNTITSNPNRIICAEEQIPIQTDPAISGGNGRYQYQWQSSTDNVTFTNIQGATTRNYTFISNTFVGTQYFRRVVTSGPANTGCSSTSNVVSITVNPPITGNNEITSNIRSLCTNTYLLLEAPVATGGGGNIRYKWQSSLDQVNYVDLVNFNRGTPTYLYNPGDYVGDIYIRRVVTSDGGCSNATTPIRVTVRNTPTYTLVLTANPFPVCGQAIYTAKVYRDVTSVTYPTAPQYGEPTVTGGTDVTSEFDFEWWKNDANPIPGSNSNQITLAALQSRDYYTVRANHARNVPSCFLYNNRPDLRPAVLDDNDLYSNRIYRGAPIGYSVSVAINTSNAICAGASVRFTATPSSANFVNPRYQWQINGKDVAGATASTFTSSTLNYGDKVRVTFTSNENRCEPIVSNEITMIVASPQVLSGGGSYCATDPVGGVAIQLDGSQVGVSYQLMLGTTKVFLPVPGDGGPISFGFHKYTPGTYSVQAITAAGACTPFGSATVSHTPALNHTVTIKEPSETVVGEPATFEAVSSIATTTPIYRWSVFNFDNPAAGFVVQQQGTSNVFTLNSVPEGEIAVQVEVIAPNGLCTNIAGGIALAATGPIAPLPVELIYLRATKQNNDVVAVEWATAMEQNSEGFEVQVSQDAQNYRTLAFVASKADGNTNQKQVYTFHDKENGKYGTRYYRLMQRDMNGDSEYFGPKAVLIGEAAESLSVYPNPFSNEVTLQLNAEEAGTMHVLVTNAIGAKVLERTLNIQKGSNKQSLQFKADLPLGMYHITTRLNGKTRHIKLLKQ